MSDYFASLMRASAPAASGVRAGEPVARPLAAMHSESVAPSDPTFATTVPSTPLARPAALAAPPERAAPPLTPAPEHDATIPARDVVIHAAMRWVAEGEAPPPRPDASPAQARPKASSTPTPVRTAAAPVPPLLTARASDDRAALAVVVPVGVPTAPPAQAVLAEHAAPARAPLKALATNDIEVSIGAIHLRVDAPPAVSAAPPAPKPQSQSQRATASSSAVRGSLARRALRRL